jgi:hypothetical protein
VERRARNLFILSLSLSLSKSSYARTLYKNKIMKTSAFKNLYGKPIPSKKNTGTATIQVNTAVPSAGKVTVSFL